MKKTNLIYACALLSLFITTGSNAQCELLCNGDFDAFNSTNGNIALVTAPSSQMTCWNTDAQDQLIEVWPSVANTPPAFSGIQFIELNANYQSTVWQDFANTPLDLLTISWAHRGRWSPVTSDIMAVEIGPPGGPYQSFGNFAANNTGWVQNTVFYTVPSGQTVSRIRFISVWAAGPNQQKIGNFLDAVSVTAPHPTVSIVPSAVTICPFTPISLVANGANTYTWVSPPVPSGQKNNSVVNLNPGPGTTTTYSVTGTGGNGCTDGKAVTITVLPVNVNVSAQPAVICNGVPILLTASGAQNYTWMPNVPGPTGNTWLINPAPVNTVVTVLGQAANGCTKTAAITLNPGQTIPLTVNDVTLCSNAATCTQISVSSSFPGSVSYIWQPGNLNGSQVTVCPNITTVYNVYASSPTGCGNSAAMSVVVNDDCCAQPTVGFTALTGNLSGAYPPGSYLIDANISLNGNASFVDSEIMTRPGVEIEVPTNKNLTFDHTHLYACGLKMWQGIVVRDGGQVVNTSSSGGTSLLEDAEVGIDIDNNNSAVATPPVLLDYLVFNKNYIGIRITNSSLPHFAIGIESCVFSCHNLPFSSPGPFSSISWPYATPSGQGLRATVNGTTSLFPPCDMQNGFYAPVNLKFPHTGQPSEIGIKIESVGNVAGGAPTAGVEFGVTYNSQSANNYNYFTGLRKGIDVLNASLTTFNNIFEKMQGVIGSGYGVGIRHEITSQMNAALDLRPVGGNFQSISYGNRFWDCITGISAKNVYHINVEYGLFRGTHTLPSGGAGVFGVITESNRFKYNFRFSDFNNLTYGIWITASHGQYSMGGSSGTGTYANNIEIEQNYFGAAVTSVASAVTRYCSWPVTLHNWNAVNWNFVGTGARIISNKINRAYRGIKVNSFGMYPIEIGGNYIQLSNDQLPTPTDQYGIFVRNNPYFVIVGHNTVTAMGTTNTLVKEIISENNTGTNLIYYNHLFDGHIGFEFDGNNLNTLWTCNTMNQPMNYGLSLVNNGILGPQGNNMNSSGNKWNPAGSWSGIDYTICDPNSTPGGSAIYTEICSICPPPTHAGSPNQYTNFGDFFFCCYNPNAIMNDCAGNISPYAPVPGQRSAVTGVIVPENGSAGWNVTVYPNPANDHVFIESTVDDEMMGVSIIGVDGKVVLSREIKGAGDLDIKELSQGIYFIEIHSKDKQVLRKKLVIGD